MLTIVLAGISIAATVKGTQAAGVVACAKRKIKLQLVRQVLADLVL